MRPASRGLPNHGLNLVSAKRAHAELLFLVAAAMRGRLAVKDSVILLRRLVLSFLQLEDIQIYGGSPWVDLRGLLALFQGEMLICCRTLRMRERDWGEVAYGLCLIVGSVVGSRWPGFTCGLDCLFVLRSVS